MAAPRLLPYSIALAVLITALFGIAGAEDTEAPSSASGKKKGIIETRDGIQVSIANPTGDPTQSGSWDGTCEFTFDASSTGYCLIKCEATLGPDNADTQSWADDNLVWSLSYNHYGSTIEWGDYDESTNDPVNGFTADDNKGKTVWARIASLPPTNTALGDHSITLTVGTETATAPIQIFFKKDAKNHSSGRLLPENEKPPNWYWYWAEVDSDVFQFLYGYALTGENATTYRGVLDWTGNINAIHSNNGLRGAVYMSAEAASEIQIDANGANRGRSHKLIPPATSLTIKGIDLTCRIAKHELKHKSEFVAAWGGYTDTQIKLDQPVNVSWWDAPWEWKPLSEVAGIDKDADYYSDTYETGRQYKPGRMFNPNDKHSLCKSLGHGAPYHRNDFETVADEHDRDAWVMGSGNSADWANPGRRHGTNDVDD